MPVHKGKRSTGGGVGGPRNIKGKGVARQPLPGPKTAVKMGPKPRETGRPRFTKKGKR